MEQNKLNRRNNEPKYNYRQQKCINISHTQLRKLHIKQCLPYTPTGTYRTTDLNYTVTRVGTELEKPIKKI